MSVLDDIIPEGAEAHIDDEAPEAPTEAPLSSDGAEPADDATPAVDAAETHSAADVWAAAREAGLGNIVDQYQGDPVKIAKALADSKAYISGLGNQPQPEPEEEAPEPLSSAPIVWPPENVPDLYSAAAADPALVGKWVLDNPNRVEPNVLQELYNNWFYTNPAQAHSYATHKQQQEWEARMEERFAAVQEATAPLQQEHSNTIIETAKDLARKQIGDADYTAALPQLHALFEDQANQDYYFRHGNSPAKLAQGMVEAFKAIKANEWWEQRGQAPPAGDAEPAPTPRTTTTRRGSAAPAAKGHAAIVDSIIPG